MSKKRLSQRFPFLIVTLLAAAVWVPAQSEFPADYLKPPSEIDGILTRNAHFDVLETLSPDGSHMLIPVQEPFSDLEKMSRKVYRLAMLEISPEANRQWRLTTYGLKGLKIYSLEEKQSRAVTIPEGMLISDITWSPDGSQVAFLGHVREGSQVWIADTGTGQARRLSDRFVMATISAQRSRGSADTAPSSMLQWLPDGSILTLLVPQNRGPEPQDPAVATTPLIRHTREKPAPTPTYPFLLRTPTDKELFAYYTTSQLAVLRTGSAPRNLGSPAQYMNISLSPDGRHILAEKVKPPYSYLVSWSSFPKELVVLDTQGRQVSQIRDIPLHESPVRGRGEDPDRFLPRDVAWRPDSSLSFLWREKSENGESGEEASDPPAQDRLMHVAAPFDVSQATTLATSKKTFNDIVYAPDSRYAFARLSGRGEGAKDVHQMVVYDLQESSPEPRILADGIDPDDVLTQPRQFLAKMDGNGNRHAVISSDGAAFLSGEGYRDDFRPRPFIDRVNLASQQTTRVFESSAELYQSPVAALDPGLNELIIRSESISAFPDFHLRSGGGSMDRLTNNRNPFPEVANVKRVDFSFTRRDGLEIYGRISLPVGYQEGTRVPAVFWTYPREYTSPKAYKNSAIESRNNKEFPHLDYRNASDIWLTQGYAVVEPDIPIIGKGDTYNDNYVAHLVDSMYGAIRRVDQLGYVDVDRLGHGGHSYGAFATANILARAPYFKAGIGGDGAYNRTLTPMTFQREQRYLWEATDTIIEMSPFFQADHLETPLLMYHGADDNNTGTFLIQSERLIQALTGLGKTAVLYIYPYESHGPRAIETYQDLWNRWLHWFDKYVKQGDQGDTMTGASGGNRSP